MAFKIAFALAAAALAIGPVAAGAQTTDQRTTGVAYRDLNLTTEAGRAELDRRIDAAARQVCAIDETTLGTRIVSREKRACYRDALAQMNQRFARIIEEGRDRG